MITIQGVLFQVELQRGVLSTGFDLGQSHLTRTNQTAPSIYRKREEGKMQWTTCAPVHTSGVNDGRHKQVTFVLINVSNHWEAKLRLTAAAYLGNK